MSIWKFIVQQSAETNKWWIFSKFLDFILFSAFFGFERITIFILNNFDIFAWKFLFCLYPAWYSMYHWIDKRIRALNQIYNEIFFFFFASHLFHSHSMLNKLIGAKNCFSFDYFNARSADLYVYIRKQNRSLIIKWD